MKETLQNLYNLLCDLRRLEYYTQRPEFDSIPDKKTVEELLKGAMSPDPKLRTTCIKDLAEMLRHFSGKDVGIRDLKDQAFVRGIKNWSRLPKEVLMRKIKEHDERRKSGRVDDGAEGTPDELGAGSVEAGVQERKAG